MWQVPRTKIWDIIASLLFWLNIFLDISDLIRYFFRVPPLYAFDWFDIFLPFWIWYFYRHVEGICAADNTGYKWQVSTPEFFAPLFIYGTVSKLRGEKKHIHDALILKCGRKEAEINCVHVVLNTPLDIDEISEASENNDFQKLKKLKPGDPVDLPIEDHLIASNSFAAAIAEMGIPALYENIITSPDLDFGFNYHMVVQFDKALKKVNPALFDWICLNVALPFIETFDPSSPEEKIGSLISLSPTMLDRTLKLVKEYNIELHLLPRRSKISHEVENNRTRFF
jgi:hypothetical protein